MKLLLHSSAGERYHQSALDFVTAANTHSILIYMHLETYYSRSFNVTTASKTSLFYHLHDYYCVYSCCSYYLALRFSGTTGMGISATVKAEALNYSLSGLA